MKFNTIDFLSFEIYKRVLLVFLTTTGFYFISFSQTEFDSLKRNSMLDTLYQPSKKPTFVTEFAELKISGFVQPAIYFDNNNVFSNDLFVTSQIPTTSITNEKFRRFHMSANQSRLGFGFRFPQAKHDVSAFIEGDFLSSTEGEHNYFRLRHAYLSADDFLFGHSWTNFGDVNGSPNTLDLEGPNSIPASRVAQIKWSRQLKERLKLIMAIEEPKADYTPLDSASEIKSAIPEFVLKPEYKFKKVHWINSFVYKTIIYSDKNLSFKKRLPAWGFTSSLTLPIPERKILNPFGIKKRILNVFFIVGEGTQGSVNDFGGLGYEAFPKDSVTLETLIYFGGYISYSFVFGKRWSTTYVFSYLNQERPKITDNIFKRSNYITANAVYALNKYFTVGGELLYGYKLNHDNTDGSAVRVLGIIRLIF